MPEPSLDLATTIKRKEAEIRVLQISIKQIGALRRELFVLRSAAALINGTAVAGPGTTRLASAAQQAIALLNTKKQVFHVKEIAKRLEAQGVVISPNGLIATLHRCALKGWISRHPLSRFGPAGLSPKDAPPITRPCRVCQTLFDVKDGRQTYCSPRCVRLAITARATAMAQLQGRVTPPHA